MSCAAWEERIALAAGGEIERIEVDGHLAGCEECRRLYDDIVALRGEMASLATADEAGVAAVHAAVMRQVRRRRSMPLLRYAVAAAVATVVLGWTLVRPERVSAPASPAPPTVVAHALSAPSRSPGRLLRTPPANPSVRPRPPAPAEPTIIHMQTEDPDVLIIWIAE
jgi:hypothetical protein